MNTEVLIFDPVVMLKPEKITLGPGSRIDSFAKLEGGEGLFIGACVHIASFAHVGIGGGTCILEDFVNVSSGGKIISGTNLPEAWSLSAVSPPEMQRVVHFTTTLRRYSAIMTNAIVLPGLTLNEGAVLGAGSIATRDIPAWEIWVGNPARFLRQRARQVFP